MAASREAHKIPAENTGADSATRTRGGTDTGLMGQQRHTGKQLQQTYNNKPERSESKAGMNEWRIDAEGGGQPGVESSVRGGAAVGNEGRTGEGDKDGVEARRTSGYSNRLGPKTRRANNSSKRSESGNGKKTRSSTRRRALLGSYSDEDEEERTINGQQTNQLTNVKEMAPPSQDYDIDMQLEDMSSEHGGSSLQLSTSRDEYVATPNQADIPSLRLEVVNLVNRTPPTSMHNDNTADTQSA